MGVSSPFGLKHGFRPLILENALSEQPNRQPKETNADRLSRFIVAVVTCLGALGLVALLYFPLHYLK
ncbi:hypothetical protein GCM10027343_15850 [Noviherbaspirillum agri]